MGVEKNITLIYLSSHPPDSTPESSESEDSKNRPEIRHLNGGPKVFVRVFFHEKKSHHAMEPGRIDKTQTPGSLRAIENHRRDQTFFPFKTWDL